MKKLLVICLFFAACGSGPEEKKVTVCDCMKPEISGKKQKECEQLIMSLGYEVDKELAKCDFRSNQPRRAVKGEQEEVVADTLEVTYEVDTLGELQETDSVGIKEKIEELNRQLEEMRQ